MESQPLRPDEVEIRDFQFDDRNRSHMALKGLTEDIVWDVWERNPRVFENPPAPTRSGSHRMIGPTADGRHWTVVITLIDDQLSLWRPITGWPSTRKEERAWHAEN